MMKNVQRILSVFLTALMLAVVVIPVHALPVPGTLYETIDFYSHVYGIYRDWRVSNPNSDYSQFPGFRGGGFGSDPDKVGGGSFSKDDAKAAYDNYVNSLPAQGYNSSGNLTWQPLLSDFDLDKSVLSFSIVYNSFSNVKLSVFPYSGDRSGSNATWKFDFVSSSNAISALFSEWHSAIVRLNGSVEVPFSGSYRVISSPFYSASGLLKDGAAYKDSGLYSVSSFSHVSAGELFAFRSGDSGTPTSNFSSLLYTIYSPVLEVVPDTALNGDTYNINTRPTSITGGNYGIVGDNGQITKVEDNSTIVNETNNTFYNPATGTTVPISNWSYDYSDRSYNVTTESGDTVSITYGDENIVIKEGDTVYNIYYLIEGSGSENPPSTCEHTWTETSTTPATCTLPGSKLSTCSKCQQTKTETIPALGHNWQVKQTVTTQYDEGGNLTQQGYTIFECSRCHEQYKSTDGTIPPGGGSGTDPGGEEGETTIGGLIEKLLSGVGSIVGGIIKGLFSLLTKAVEALAGLAELFTTFVGSLVELWGGFTSFLSAVFPFLPEEFVIIIELGLILMIAAAVFRKFIS